MPYLLKVVKETVAGAGAFSFKSSRVFGKSTRGFLPPCAVTGVTIAFYLFLLHISKLKLKMKSKTKCP